MCFRIVAKLYSQKLCRLVPRMLYSMFNIVEISASSTTMPA